MDRRESLKALFLGGVGASLFMSSCVTEKETPVMEGDVIEPSEGYGRTPDEASRDEALFSQTFFTKEEMVSISLMADIILPEDEESISATEAGVPEFIEFIVKDMPEHQLPMRGGLMWLKRESNRKYGLDFSELSSGERLEIVDRIAYPAEAEKNTPGPVFFEKIRQLVITGYFTSEPGIKYLGYMGNQANVWDGVPQHVLDKHGVRYDERMLAIAMDPATRAEVMDWNTYEFEQEEQLKS